MTRSSHKKTILTLIILSALGVSGYQFDKQFSRKLAQNSQNPVKTVNVTPEKNVSSSYNSTSANNCQGLDEVWKHVYSGDPRKFSKPQDRLKIIDPCKTITGTIVNAKAEADGDYHIRLDVDEEYKNLLNDKNISGQRGYLVLEPVCENPVSQRDTLEEGVCNGYAQHVFTQDMIGKQVTVTGAYTEDREHGWREIHPILSITVVP